MFGFISYSRTSVAPGRLLEHHRSDSVVAGVSVCNASGFFTYSSSIQEISLWFVVFRLYGVCRDTDFSGLIMTSFEVNYRS